MGTASCVDTTEPLWIYRDLGFLLNKTALVTGSSRGIGKAVALRLAREGATVIAHYGSGQSCGEATLAELRNLNPECSLVQADLSDLAQVKRLAERVSQRPLDLLVNNAGVVGYGDFALAEPEELERHWRVNVRAPFCLTRWLLPVLTRGSRIVNLSSMAATLAFAEVLEYSMTKGAIESFTRALASSLGPRGINVNAVAPGEIQTDMSAWLQEDDARSMVLERQIIQRLGTAEDVAGVVAFLCSPDSEWMTGQVLSITGGYRL
jgi:3-oxoacyl-[acyl-carrier protein] reductase